MKHELSRGQRRLLVEMAKDSRVILLQKHPRLWMGLRYSINSFPMRTLGGTMVAKLAQLGYLKLDRRGYYVLSTKGLLEASITDIRSRK